MKSEVALYTERIVETMCLLVRVADQCPLLAAWMMDKDQTHHCLGTIWHTFNVFHVSLTVLGIHTTKTAAPVKLWRKFPSKHVIDRPLNLFC